MGAGFGPYGQGQVAPDVISYTTAVSASEKWRAVGAGFGCFVEMWRGQVAPELISYYSAVSACEIFEQ